MSMTGKGRRIHCVMRIASLFRRAMSAGVLVLVTLGVDAGEVPSAPMLRIETGHHTSFIQSLAYDESRQRLITVSDDKTIRVWQLPALAAVTGKKSKKKKQQTKTKKKTQSFAFFLPPFLPPPLPRPFFFLLFFFSGLVAFVFVRD